jgi:hypothetical protein
MASTGVVKDALFLQGPGRSYLGEILTTLENQMLFAAEAIYTVMEVSDKYWVDVLP